MRYHARTRQSCRACPSCLAGLVQIFARSRTKEIPMRRRSSSTKLSCATFSCASFSISRVAHSERAPPVYQNATRRDLACAFLHIQVVGPASNRKRLNLGRIEEVPCKGIEI